MLRLTWRRGVLLAAMLGTAIALVIVPTSALAVHDAGCATSANFGCLFELDGNVQNDAASAGNNGGYDWGTGPGGAGVFDSAGKVTSTVAADPSFLTADFNADYATPDKSYFATSNKDTDDVSTWQCGSINNPTTKDNLLNAYAALFSPTSGVDQGHVVLYAGAERESNNGDSFMGFWLFKSPVSCNSPTGAATSFTGSHSVGDLLILSNFTGGGSNPLVQVYEWGTPNPGLNLLFDGVPCSSASAGDKACGAVNTSSFTTPWPNSTGTSQAIDSNEFVEVGVDLTSLLNLTTNSIPCFARFQAETRSSQQTSATLKDFAAGNFNSCSSTTVTTPQNANGGSGLSDSSPVPASTVIRDQAVVTGNALVGTAPNPKGTVKFSYCSTTDQTPGGSTACAGASTDAGTATVDGTANPATVYSNNIPANTLSAGRYCFTATFTDTSSPPNYPDGSSDSSKTECFMIAKASPTIVTNASTKNGNVVGTASTCDSATLSGSYNGTGTITFTLKAPDNSSSQIGSPVTVSGDGTYQSPSCPLMTQVGTYTWSASYSGDGNNNGAIDNGQNETATSVKASPIIVTNASTKNGNVVGTASTCDSATLSGSYNGTGTITFSLKAPDNSVSQIGSPVAVSGDGTYQSPSCPLMTQVGTYKWSASYSGDSLNNGAVDNGQNESVDSIKASPTIVTNASTQGGNVVGTGTTCDSATLSGSYNGTGTITFTLKAPDNSVSTVGSVQVGGDGTYDSPSCPLLTQVGTYTWSASYSGDSLNNGALDDGQNESVDSIKASPNIVTNATTKDGNVVGSGSTCDSATLSGSYNGTGTITFSLTKPDNTTSQVGSPVAVTGDGTYQSPSCPLMTQVGTYTWSASYSGDSLNNGTVDNGQNESVTSVKASPQITTQTDPASGSVGDLYKDKATLSGTFNPDGSASIDWTLYPNDDCSGTPLGTDSVSPINADGTFETPNGVTVNKAGTYYWVASFTGDSNNKSAQSGCADEPVTVIGADIHIVKTADKAQVNAGDPIGFTLTVYNDGGGDAKGVNLSDTLPTNAGLDWSIDGQGSGWGGSCAIAAGVLSCGPATVPANTTQAASTFTVHITSPTTADTSGTCPDGSGVVNNTGNVTTTNDGSDQSSASTCVAAPDIHIVKTADAAQVNAGDPIGFTLTVSNDGSGDAYGVNLSDTLPTNAGLDWSIDKQGAGWNSSCGIAAGVLTCGPATVPAGTTQADSTFTVHITSGTTAATGGDCPETGVVHNTGNVTTTNDGSDQSSASTCVAAPDIHIVKTADAAQVNAGDPIGFTLTVSNSGSGDAYGVKLTDTLPVKAGLSWSIAGQGSGWNNSCAIAAGVLTCGPATVPANTTQAASTFTVHITSPTTAATGGVCPEGSGVVHNTGDVTTTNDGSDQSSASTCVAAPDIHIVKTADAAQVNAGDPIGFTLTVSNSGSGDAKGVKLSDTLPVKPGLSWSIAGQGSGWNNSCAIAAGVLTCGPVTVPAGTTQANSTFTVHITSPTTAATGGTCPGGSGVVNNTGNVTTTNDGSDQSSASTCVAAPAIHIVKKADAAQVNVGQQIGFTLTVYNSGSGDAKGVKLADPLPTNPGLDWSIAGQGSGWNGSCSIAGGVLSCGPVTVPAGTTQSASTFTVHIVSGTTGATGGDCTETGVVHNTGSVTTTNDGSDQSSASTCVQALVDLSITKSGSPATQILGTGNITWTMVVTNNGPSADTGVKVSDPMPAGNTYVSSSTTQGTCTGGAILNCDIGDMAVGAQVTITLVTTPSAAGEQTNTAVTSGDRPETNLANNTASATVEVTQQILKPPCVAVSKITPGQLIVGRKTTVTIHLKQGHKAAVGFKVRIKGAGINAVTKRSNAKGVVKHILKMKKKGILVFTPVAGQNAVGCSGKRIGVRGVFTPPVTG
ncbi:MAG TPA: DUF11 domain-containing protein [Gaiellaceae bacterium]|nr:DUF11 domain-containing protein [Gaiellaceae bacterium]